MEIRFDKRLYELRIEMKLTQVELSKKSGVSASNITKYERGIRLPTVEILVQLAQFFDVSVDYILGLED